MTAKRVFLAVCITALVLTIILISLKAYYVLVAIIIGTVVMAYRELWSLVRTKKIPPVDERVRENTSKSIRNGFIFFAIALIFLMLIFSINTTLHVDIIHLLGGLFLSTGVVYLASYVFYDRAEPKLGERGLMMIKIFLIVAAASLAVFILSAFLHNIVSGLMGTEEPVFFFIAIILAPLGFAVGLIGSLVIFVKGLLARAS